MFFARELKISHPSERSLPEYQALDYSDKEAPRLPMGGLGLVAWSLSSFLVAKLVEELAELDRCSHPRNRIESLEG
jgi:hypothetical protein